ncbi:hypothetical protein [Halobacteriovorax sp.]|uniref:hypothetical protein n=1 Tax=Halobacteriovorax sp. TaxID=2020862 RepID=UPI003563F665
MRKASIVNVLFLALLLFMSGCDQNMLGAGYAIKNVVAKPFQAIGSYFTDNAYEDIEQKSTSKNSIPTECWVKRKSVLPGMEGIQNITDVIRENVCSCVPWGSCTVDECPCSRMCPDGFDIFKRPGQKTMSEFTTLENSLSFSNGGGGGEIESTQGFCWGHASVTSQFNRLAFFDKSAKPEYSLNSKDKSEQKKAFEYYKDLIDNVIDNKPTKIPGIKNLNELSGIPGIESYMADKVAHSWGKRAMSTQGLSVGLSSSAMKRSESEEFFKSIKEKIDNNQQPQIVFTKRNKRMITHAVLVSDYTVDRNGNTVLCIRDNNISRRRVNLAGQSCSDKMTIGADGGISYSLWGDIGGAELAFNDNSDALEQMRNLKEHCDSEKGCDQ